MQSVDDILASIIGLIGSDEELDHLLPILLEAKRSFSSGNEFSKDDVDQTADLIQGLHSEGDALEKALRYAERSGPNMFARAVAVEIERRLAQRDQFGALLDTNK